MMYIYIVNYVVNFVNYIVNFGTPLLNDIINLMERFCPKPLSKFFVQILRMLVIRANIGYRPYIGGTRVFYLLIVQKVICMKISWKKE